jgi:hypothetical protein
MRPTGTPGPADAPTTPGNLPSMADSESGPASSWQPSQQPAPICAACKSESTPEERKLVVPPHSSTWVLLVCPSCGAIVAGQRQ